MDALLLLRGEASATAPFPFLDFLRQRRVTLRRKESQIINQFLHGTLECCCWYNTCARGHTSRMFLALVAACPLFRCQDVDPRITKTGHGRTRAGRPPPRAGRPPPRSPQAQPDQRAPCTDRIFRVSTSGFGERCGRRPARTAPAAIGAPRGVVHAFGRARRSDPTGGCDLPPYIRKAKYNDEVSGLRHEYYNCNSIKSRRYVPSSRGLIPHANGHAFRRTRRRRARNVHVLVSLQLGSVRSCLMSHSLIGKPLAPG